MLRYLTEAQLPAVRAAIDVSLDASNLPDDVLMLPQYVDEAERWVRQYNPAAATYEAGTEDYLRTQVAAIYACAALVCPAVPQMTSEEYTGEYRYNRSAVDTTKLTESLWQRARLALDSAGGTATPTSTVGIPSRFVFTRARARYRR